MRKNTKKSPKPIAPPGSARGASEGMPISPGIIPWCARTQEATQAEWPGEGLGHRGGAISPVLYSSLNFVFTQF